MVSSVERFKPEWRQRMTTTISPRLVGTIEMNDGRPGEGFVQIADTLRHPRQTGIGEMAGLEVPARVELLPVSDEEHVESVLFSVRQPVASHGGDGPTSNAITTPCIDVHQHHAVVEIGFPRRHPERPPRKPIDRSHPWHECATDRANGSALEPKVPELEQWPSGDGIDIEINRTIHVRGKQVGYNQCVETGSRKLWSGRDVFQKGFIDNTPFNRRW